MFVTYEVCSIRPHMKVTLVEGNSAAGARVRAEEADTNELLQQHSKELDRRFVTDASTRPQR